MSWIAWKSSREPKKGGAGGGYTWGKAGKQDLREVRDKEGDPNYDSEGEENVVMQVVDVHEKHFCDEGNKSEEKKDAVRKLKRSQSLSMPYDGLIFLPGGFDFREFQVYIRDTIDDYLSSGDRKDTIQKFNFVDLPKVNSLLISRLLQLMVEKDEGQREAILELIIKMPYLTPASIRRGFDRLYWDLSDLMIDVPDAPDILISILIRMIQERLIPTEIISRIPILVLKCLKNPKFSLLLPDLDLVNAIQEEKKKASEFAREFINSRDLSDQLVYYDQGANKAIFKSYFLKKLIEISFDGKNEHKDFVCTAIKQHTDSGFFPTASLKYALDDLIWNLNDLQVDIPNVSSVLARFITRLVLDETVVVTFIEESELSHPELGDDTLESYCLHEALNLKDQPSFRSNLEKIWGNLATIDSLKEVIKNNIDEYLISLDEQEALRHFKHLKSPYYMHEFVKRAMITAIEKVEQRSQLVRLIQLMSEQLLLSSTQLQIGFKRVEEALPDLKLDVPNAAEIHTEIIEKLKALGIKAAII